MKSFWIILLSCLSLLGAWSLILIILEPYYGNELYQNIVGYNDFDKFEKELWLKQQEFVLGDIKIDESNNNSYILISKDYFVKHKELKLSVVTWRLSYNIFSYNSWFVSRVSPSRIQYIDNYSHLGKWDDSFKCLKILPPASEVSIWEKCKYIPITYLDFYPQLKLEIASTSGTIINFE